MMDPKIIMGKQVKDNVAGATGKSWMAQAEDIISYKFPGGFDVVHIFRNTFFPHGWAHVVGVSELMVLVYVVTQCAV